MAGAGQGTRTRHVSRDMSDHSCASPPVLNDMPDRTATRTLAIVSFVRATLVTLTLGCTAEPANPPAPAPVAPEAPRLTPLAPVARIEAADLWQDLLAQRPSALVVTDERLVVDLGRASARTELELVPVSPWRLAQEVGDVQAGLLVGAGGSLALPLDGDLAPALHPDVDGQSGLAMAITLQANRPGQTMTVLWNEVPLANLSVGESWERRTFSLPAATIKPGENRLRLHFAKPAAGGQATAAIQRVELGPRAPIVAGPGRRALHRQRR